MNIYSSTLISDLNRCFEPNPSNTGSPIPSPALSFSVPLIQIQTEPLAESATPELTSSPTSTAPSSPRSSRSALSLDDPEIRKIWDDPRFGPVNGTLDSFTPAISPSREEEYILLNTPIFSKDGCGAREPFVPSGTLNPLAQPFVPHFVVQDIQRSHNMDHASMFYGNNTLLLPLDPRNGPHGSPSLRAIEEYTPFCYPPQFHSAPVGLSDIPRPLDLPYPPGLPHPPQNLGRLHALGDVRVSAARSPLAFSSILVEAFLPIYDNSARDALLQTLFDRIERWDLFTLRELTLTMMVTAFGNERDLVLPCSEKGCPSHADERIDVDSFDGQDRATLPVETFHQVVAGFAKILRRTSEQFLADTFLVQVIDSLSSRFILCFDPDKPGSLNTYYETHQSPPCISYIRYALSLCKAIAFLYQQSIAQSIDVDRCIMLLLQDLMSVEHLQALRSIVVGSGIKLWDPPLSMLTTAVPVEAVPASPASFTFPPIKQQAKAKLRGDITMFCSKLDSYKMKRGQSGCASLRGQDWNLSGEAYRARVMEVTDIVHEWERELVELIDRREELVSSIQ